MVRIKSWTGRFGNNFFQYAAARVIAKLNNLFLETKWIHNDILQEVPWDNNGKKIEPSEMIDDDAYINNRECFYRNFSKSGVIMNGYWQDAGYFIPLRDEICKWFEQSMYPRNTEDWVCHYRVGDYWLPQVSSVINPNWYIKILHENKVLNKKKIYIVTECPDDPCVEKLANSVHGEVISRSAKEDFHFLMSFDHVIGSNGSFSWWAMFLGRPKVAFMFENWMRLHHNMSLQGVREWNWISGDYSENKKMADIWTAELNKRTVVDYWNGWKNADKKTRKIY